MEPITEYLLSDHQRLDALLARSGNGAEIDAVAFEKFRAGLLRHIAIEEKVLLPAARTCRGGRPLDRAVTVRVDHGAIAMLLVGPPDLNLCAEISTLLDLHNPLEEGPGGIYEECELLFSPEQSLVLGRVARDFPPVRTAPYTKGPGVRRTARDALAAVGRLNQLRESP